eukprot:1855726-Amphidinium_carterae.1
MLRYGAPEPWIAPTHVMPPWTNNALLCFCHETVLPDLFGAGTSSLLCDSSAGDVGEGRNPMLPRHATVGSHNPMLKTMVMSGSAGGIATRHPLKTWALLEG